jgi:E3 ubiquitin-protein ligase HECTD1
VADGALRCFASLSDRFTRRGIDPAPLAEHGLVKDLLAKMSSTLTTTTGGTNANSSTPNASAMGASGVSSTSNTPNEGKNTATISTIISLLSTLCRGSPSITQVCSSRPNFWI